MFFDGLALSVSGLAEALGKKCGQGTWWERSDLPKIAELVHNMGPILSNTVDINGIMPGWLASTLAHELYPRQVRLSSPDGHVTVQCQLPEGNGSGCIWTVAELGVTGNGRRLMKVEFKLPSVKFAPAYLQRVAPPKAKIGRDDVIVLSGRGRNWFVASVAMSYYGQAAACAVFQPEVGGIVVWTRAFDIDLGAVLP